METSDYLMRQFNQLGKVLGKLLADLFEPDNTATAHQLIENINQELITALNLDINKIIEIPSEKLIAELEEKYEAKFVNFEDFAEFLYQVGHLYQGQNKLETSKLIFKQAFTIYNHLLEKGNTFSLEIHQRCKELENILF